MFVLAHTVLYTYIATFLARLDMARSTDLVLLVFGAASMLSIWVVGVHIDRRLRALTIASTFLLAVAASVLAALAGSPALVYLAVTLWGLGWGGAPTLLQTAAGNAGGAVSSAVADSAQAMLVTLWNGSGLGGRSPGRRGRRAARGR